MITDLFNFKTIEEAVKELVEIVTKNQAVFNVETIPFIKKLEDTVTRLRGTATKFAPVLQEYLLTAAMPAENQPFQERLKKAASWFSDTLQKDILAPLKDSPAVTDSKTISLQYNEALNNIYKLSLPVYELFHECINGFSLNEF